MFFFDSSFRWAFHKIWPHYIMEFLMFFFLLREGIVILYDRLIHPKEFPKHIINTNKCPGCTGKVYCGGRGGAQMKHSRDDTKHFFPEQ